MALPRKLTAAEKVIFTNDFPLLDVDFTIVTDEPTGNYNCISWTVGVTNYWHWPGSNLTDFDNFYLKMFVLVRNLNLHWIFIISSSYPNAIHTGYLYAQCAQSLTSSELRFCDKSSWKSKLESEYVVSLSVRPLLDG